MRTQEPGARAIEDPEGQLESALIEEFLRSRGFDSSALRALPEDEAKRLRAEATVHAAARLAEVDARAHFVHNLHGDH